MLAYSILDIEDAAKKGLVSYHDLIAWLRHQTGNNEIIKKLCDSANQREEKYRGLHLSGAELSDISMQMLRVNVIGVMVNAATAAFVKHIDEIRTGEFDKELIKVSEAKDILKALKDFGKKEVYSHRSVLEVELTGHSTIQALMDAFWIAIRDRSDPDDISIRKNTPHSEYVFSRISENYRRAASESAALTMPMRYRELQLMTDMISGMTDSYAITLRGELERFHA